MKKRKKKKNYSNISKSLIHKILSNIYRIQGNIKDSINEANNSLKYFEDSYDKVNNELKDEKEELTLLIYNNYIQCSSLKYEKLIIEGNIAEAEKYFQENIQKLKKFKNEWIISCSKILSEKKQYLKAYNKAELIQDNKFNNDKLEILINYLNELLLKENFEEKKCLEYVDIVKF